ncbi:peptidoglycan-binding domain-containing protein [Promicromonospora sp. NPDC023805]|uniref:peptidoglycan-binding domain-containing protein n=1 Tax=Promicromonospora sp. NPDC023805 TaxID=3154696 RepID=UPI00340507B4
MLFSSITPQANWGKMGKFSRAMSGFSALALALGAFALTVPQAGAVELPTPRAGAVDTAEAKNSTPVTWCTGTGNYGPNISVTWILHIPDVSSSDCYLVKGLSRRDSVESLQRTLNRCYGENLVPDGIFGDRTEGALWRAQVEEGITADGEYGPQTRDALAWHVVNGGGCVDPIRLVDF